MTVSISDDGILEETETFRVELSGESVLVTASVATVTILDDDVEIGFEQLSYEVSEGADSVTLNVLILSGELGEGSSVTVVVMTMDESAIAGEDYTTVSNELTFTSDVTDLTVTVPILPDDVLEGNETFRVELSGESVVATASVATVMIVDEDTVGIGFEQLSYRVLEDVGSVTLTVSVTSGELGEGVSVTVVVMTMDARRYCRRRLHYRIE